MSLKAKLEAVIYAAEEPVTLGQLASLFAEEALALKAEQEAAAQLPTGVTASAGAENLPLLGDDTLADSQSDAGQAQEQAAGQTSQSANANGPADVLDGNGSAGEAGAAEPASMAAEGALPDSAQGEGEAKGEAEAKREARSRDREVRGVLKKILDELIAGYAIDGRGIEIREIAGGYRMATKPECHDAVRSFIKGQKPALKLSLPALETLAVIAYKQPVTAPEVNEIRGVDSSGVFGSLLARKLIATAGRKQVVGRPILYKTTREFLMRFGLKDVSELPSMEEFEKMAASELEEPDAVTNEESTPEAGAEANPDAGAETNGNGPDAEQAAGPDDAAAEASNQ